MCSCKTNAASFNFKDDILPEEVIGGLYCPNCSGQADFNAETMLRDNGWVIEYDMEVAGFMSQKLPLKDITPEAIFDEGFCTWRGVYPTDIADSVREREELAKLSKINPRKYLDEIKKWGQERMQRLEAEGWRKANAVQ